MKRLSWEKHRLESKDFSIQRIIFNISILVFLRFLRFPGKISKYVHGNLRESTLVNKADKEELRNPLVAIFLQVHNYCHMCSYVTANKKFILSDIV